MVNRDTQYTGRVYINNDYHFCDVLGIESEEKYNRMLDLACGLGKVVITRLCPEGAVAARWQRAQDLTEWSSMVSPNATYHDPDLASGSAQLRLRNGAVFFRLETFGSPQCPASTSDFYRRIDGIYLD